MDSKLFSSLAVEFWKLIYSYKRSLIFLPVAQQGTVAAQIRFSERRLSTLLNESEIRLISYDGKTFEPNLPISAVNAEDFDQIEGDLIIEQTLEPTVMIGQEVESLGKVVLVEDKQNVSGN